MNVGVLATVVFTFLIGFPVASMAGLAPDTDSDGVPNVLDNCDTKANAGALFCDTDSDGYGNACDCDYGVQVATQCLVPDFNTFRSKFGEATPSTADHDCAGAVVNVTDFNVFRSLFGTTPSSGLGCAGTAGCN